MPDSLSTSPISLDPSGVDVSAFLSPNDLHVAGDLASRLETRLREILADVQERAVSIAQSARLSPSGKAADRRALCDEARASIRKALAAALGELAKRRKAAEREIPSDPGALRPDTEPQRLAWRESRAQEIRRHVASLDVLVRQVEAEEIVREGAEAVALEWLRAFVSAPVPVEGIDAQKLSESYTRRLYAEAWQALEALDRIGEVFRREAHAVAEEVTGHCAMTTVPLDVQDAANALERTQ